MKRSSSLNPVIIVIICILMAVKLFDLMSLYGRILPSGGKKSIDELVIGYQDAVNAGNSSDYLKLIPRSERTSSEKSYIKEKILDYSGNNYKMSVTSTDSADKSSAYSGTAKLVLLDPLFSPIVEEKVNVKVLVEYDKGSYYEMISVYHINGRYYIDDVDVL